MTDCNHKISCSSLVYIPMSRHLPKVGPAKYILGLFLQNIEGSVEGRDPYVADKLDKNQ